MAKSATAKLRPGQLNGKRSEEKGSERDQAVDQAISQIERQFGKGSIMWLGDAGTRLNTGVIPTGVISLDIALGIGGLPRGRVIEIYGPEGGGKTTLALNAVASAQHAGGVAAFVDAEHALDPVWAGTCGVDVEHLLVSQPDTGEQALEITEMLVRSGAVDLVVVDSVAALVPRAEIEGDMGDSLPGMQARLMSQALRKLTAAISKGHAVVIFINQIREKIGVLFGNPETTPGGRALKFYSSMRLEIPPRRNVEVRIGQHRYAGQGHGPQEQAGATVPRLRVRHHVLGGRIAVRWAARRGGGHGDRAKGRRALLLWRDAPRYGARECEELPQGACGGGCRVGAPSARSRRRLPRHYRRHWPAILAVAPNHRGAACCAHSTAERGHHKGPILPRPRLLPHPPS